MCLHASSLVCLWDVKDDNLGTAELRDLQRMHSSSQKKTTLIQVWCKILAVLEMVKNLECATLTVRPSQTEIGIMHNIIKCKKN